MSKLERLSYVVLTLTCLLVSGGWVYDRIVRHLSNQNQAGSYVSDDERMLLGKKISLSPQSRASGNNLFLFVRPGCHACTANMELYRSLTAKSPRRFRIIAVGRELEPTKRYLAQSGFKPDEVLAADFEQLGVLGTPTLLLTDQSGKVHRAWIGTVDGVRRDDLWKALL